MPLLLWLIGINLCYRSCGIANHITYSIAHSFIQIVPLCKLNIRQASLSATMKHCVSEGK